MAPDALRWSLLALLLLIGASGRGADAGSAWRALVAASEAPDVPEEWQKRDPAPAEVETFLRSMAAAASTNANQARAFYQTYPNDRRAREARLLEVRQLALATHFGLTNRQADLQKAKTALPQPLNDEERFFIESGVAYRLNYLEQSKSGIADLGVLEKEARRLQREFQGSTDADELLLEVAKGHFARDHFDQAKALAQELARAKTSGHIKESAESILARVALLGKPLALRFKAIDGREVDLEKMRGKVVLIDAWATWCVICMEKLPELKRIYAALHPQGLEVVGLNFDETRPTVEKLIAREGIAWPNYFDGKGWENKYGQEFKIMSLPALWLVDRKGIVRDLNAHQNTREKIEKLLAE